jgi:hypothetical protein
MDQIAKWRPRRYSREAGRFSTLFLHQLAQPLHFRAKFQDIIEDITSRPTPDRPRRLKLSFVTQLHLYIKYSHHTGGSEEIVLVRSKGQ